MGELAQIGRRAGKSIRAAKLIEQARAEGKAVIVCGPHKAEVKTMTSWRNSQGETMK